MAGPISLHGCASTTTSLHKDLHTTIQLHPIIIHIYVCATTQCAGTGQHAAEQPATTNPRPVGGRGATAPLRLPSEDNQPTVRAKRGEHATLDQTKLLLKCRIIESGLLKERITFDEPEMFYYFPLPFAFVLQCLSRLRVIGFILYCCLIVAAAAGPAWVG